MVEVPREWRGTTTQVAGMWPFAVGTESPMIGVPLGFNELTRATVCADPLNWFERARLISNPSAFVLGRPGLGKSTLVRRMVLGLAGQGVTPLILGDLKPDYTDLVSAIGGQVVRLGRGLGQLNVLDPGGMAAAAQRLTGADAAALKDDAHRRRYNMVLALVSLARSQTPSELERTALSTAMTELVARHRVDDPPILPDLLNILLNPNPAMLSSALTRDVDGFRDKVAPLLQSLHHQIESPMGQVFSGRTSVRLDLDAPALAVDVSAIPEGDTDLEAAVLLASWSDGFGSVNCANALTDAGLAPQRRFVLVLDELWRALRSSTGPTAGMVDRLDCLTRLNRTHGVGQIMITHSLKDLESLHCPQDVAKARGFVERAGMLFLGGVPAAELPLIDRVSELTEAERRRLTSWSSPRTLSAGEAPPGLGRFLLKLGTRPGIPLEVCLTRAERDAAVHNTNQRWTQ